MTYKTKPDYKSQARDSGKTLSPFPFPPSPFPSSLPPFPFPLSPLPKRYYVASLLSLFFCSLPLLALGKEQPRRTQPPRLVPRSQAIPFTPPNRGLPGRRQPASSRPSVGQRVAFQREGNLCSPSAKLLTALIPATNLGLTVAAHPTFFFYVPQTSASAVEFVLIDEENYNQVYEKTFTITGKPGIVGLSLPAAKMPPLKVGKTYHWYFSVICDAKDRAGDVYVDGWVQRVEPDPTLRLELQQASPPERVGVYKKYGIWQETLTMLAAQRRSRPNDPVLATEWASLLRSVELDEMAGEPMVQY